MRPAPRVNLIQRLEVSGEALGVAVLLAVLCLPMVTALAASAAASAQLRTLVEQERRPSAAAQLRLTWAALRSHPIVWAGPLTWFALATIDGLALLAGLPGGAWVAPLVMVALSAGLLVGLRAAGEWEPGQQWPTLLSHSASRLTGDMRGTLLMVFSLVMGAGLVAMLPAVVVLAPGMLVAVAGAVVRRDAATMASA